MSIVALQQSHGGEVVEADRRVVDPSPQLDGCFEDSEARGKPRRGPSDLFRESPPIHAGRDGTSGLHGGFTGRTRLFLPCRMLLRVSVLAHQVGYRALSRISRIETKPDFANLINGIPPINTQSAQTTVLVRDGSTAVVGGIYPASSPSTAS